ncbi:MAG: ATP synthase subunit I [Acidobacteria bacterium]|jgi:F1F0 ATPase subunit 2|nr:ATP synthase subunit I [Acidobacteriota bacterium]
MNETINLLYTFLIGILLGGIFFGSLWWTVRKGLLVKKSITWFFVSFWLRMAIILAGFYFSSAGNWQRLISCLLGFIISRVIIIRLTKILIKPELPTQEISHAH